LKFLLNPSNSVDISIHFGDELSLDLSFPFNYKEISSNLKIAVCWGLLKFNARINILNKICQKFIFVLEISSFLILF